MNARIRDSAPATPARNRSSVCALLWLAAACFAAASVQAEPAPAASPSSEHKPGEIKIHDTPVFKLWADRKQATAVERARAASRALERALDSHGDGVRVQTQGDARVLFIGESPFVELYEQDAQIAGDASLDLYAAKLAARTREVLVAERRRSDIAASVFSISLLVFSGLIALYLLRRIGELALQARDLMIEHPERVPAVRLNKIEVIGAAPLRALLLAAVILGRWVLQGGVVYIWLVFALSRFDATRPYTEQLTRSLLGPVSSLAQRALGALPLGVLTLALAIGVYVVLRFVELFFAGVKSGQERAAWVPRDLIAPTSVLVRAAVVILALIFAGPALTGDPESVLAKLGGVVLLSFGLAAAPLLCSGAVGLLLMFSRRLRVGHQVELAGHRGRITTVTLLDVLLRDADGCEVRVPHLVSLVHSARLHGNELRLSVELCVSPSAALQQVRQLLLTAAGRFGEHPSVELADVDAAAARFTVRVQAAPNWTASDLRLALAERLAAEGIALGHDRRGVGGT